MDKYERVERSREQTEIKENEIRITAKGKMRNSIAYATTLLQEKSFEQVVLKAMGRAISKTVTIAEILKRRIPNLHQITDISSTDVTDIYEPLEEGLDRIETTRHVSSITITLSTSLLDTSAPGYQAPLPEELLQLKEQRSAATGSPLADQSPRGGRRPRGRAPRGRGARRSFQDNDGNEHLAQAPADISVQQAADQEVQPHTEGFPPRGRGRSRGRGRGRGRRRGNFNHPANNGFPALQQGFVGSPHVVGSPQTQLSPSNTEASRSPRRGRGRGRRRTPSMRNAGTGEAGASPIPIPRPGGRGRGRGRGRRGGRPYQGGRGEQSQNLPAEPQPE